MVNAQLMLIAGDHHSYLLQCTDVVAPLVLKMWQIEKPGQPIESSRRALDLVSGLCLAPLFRKDFVAGLSKEAVLQSQAKWKRYSTEQKVGMPALVSNLVLRAMSSRLEDPVGTKEAEERIALNPAAAEVFAGRPVDEVITSWFASLSSNGNQNGLP